MVVVETRLEKRVHWEATSETSFHSLEVNFLRSRLQKSDTSQLGQGIVCENFGKYRRKHDQVIAMNVVHDKSCQELQIALIGSDYLRVMPASEILLNLCKWSFEGFVATLTDTKSKWAGDRIGRGTIACGGYFLVRGGLRFRG